MNGDGWNEVSGITVLWKYIGTYDMISGNRETLDF